MSTTGLDSEIARLYQLPLADFTSARNALAKQAGARAPEVRALQKPPVAAWAINQLFWQTAMTYDRLIGAAAICARRTPRCSPASPATCVPPASRTRKRSKGAQGHPRHSARRRAAA